MGSTGTDLNVVFWVVGGALAFAILGGVFGGIVGAMTRRDGRASGSWIGMRLADALSELFDHELSDVQKGALIGAADGAVFLGVIGVLIGLGTHYGGAEPSVWMSRIFIIVMCMIGAAIGFGVLAQSILQSRMDSLFSICLGGLGGALLTGYFVGSEHLVPGAVTGIVVGFLAFVILRAMTKRT